MRTKQGLGGVLAVAAVQHRCCSLEISCRLPACSAPARGKWGWVKETLGLVWSWLKSGGGRRRDVTYLESAGPPASGNTFPGGKFGKKKRKMGVRRRGTTLPPLTRGQPSLP